ncbi:MAG TPA: AAA family ATPase [Paraburkholderia sp.]|nr:AAA family ATPase [Paraburkholderia sp.]
MSIPTEYRMSLLRGGDLLLYRRTDLAGSSLLAVAAADGPQALARLHAEYALRERLDARWAALPLMLTRHDNRVALQLSDPGGVPLRASCGTPARIGEFLPRAAALAGAVRELHARELMHADLNPDNILVDRASSQVWLTGFGYATQYTAGTGAPRAAAGSSAYMAPEQSGLVNRAVDLRADLYALGCIYYEMLTGVPPLIAADAMTLAHSHVARRPLVPAAHVAGIPAQVSAIVMKLLAKAPEERYQSAAGLAVDLEHCASAWRRRRAIAPFPLDLHDVAYYVKASPRLYGRAPELDALALAFGRVAQSGVSEFVRLSGHSGSGKSSLVAGFAERLVGRAHGFAYGKCDQVTAAIPYSGLAQALAALIRPILGEPEALFRASRARLAQALGPSAALLTALVPELALVLGDPPALAELPPQAERERFLRAFARLVGVFAQPQRPLVLFLDDLQWMDAGTEAVLNYLLNDAGIRHLLLIGALRDNELSVAHPLRRGARVTRMRALDLALGPLAAADLAQLIADTLSCGFDEALPLATLVEEKTDGEPLFAIQFIATLAEQRLIAFDYAALRWRWHLPLIRAQGYAGNASELMLAKLAGLPPATRQLLGYLACLGNHAASGLLAAAAAYPDDKVRAALADAQRADLVYQRGDAWFFWHDRVSEAMYAMPDPREQAARHLQIGRRLAALLEATSEPSSELLFATVNQINRGSAGIVSQQERSAFGRLNLLAGQRAKAASAYASALSYLEAAAHLLGGPAGGGPAHQVALYRAECEFLTGASSDAEARLAELARCAIDLPLRAALTRLRSALYTTLDRPDLAFEVSVDYLRAVGEVFPMRPSDAQVEAELQRLLRLIGTRPIEALGDLPLTTDPVLSGTLDVYGDLIPAVLFTDLNLHDLIRLRIANLSLEHGYSDASCYGIVGLIRVIGARDGNYALGFRFGELAMHLCSARGLTRYRARVEMVYGSIVMPWVKPVKAGETFMRRALQTAFESSDPTFHVYAHRNLVSNLIFAGRPLDELLREAEAGLAAAMERQFSLVVDCHLAQIVMFRRLRGLPLDAGALCDAGYERGWVEQFARGGSSPRPIAAFSAWTHALQANLMLGNLPAALAAEQRAAQLSWSSSAFIESAEFWFFGALAHAAAAGIASPHGAHAHRAALAAHTEQLRVVAASCPQNFASRLALVEAETARIDDRPLDAQRLFDSALRQAQLHGFPQIEALANELAARLYQQLGLETAARAHWRNARAAYLYWGALAKVEQLDRSSPLLPDAAVSAAQAPPPRANAAPLDVEAVLKASHALSSEIVLSRLIDVLMSTALGLAGAERGVLALLHGDDLRIAAQASVRGNGVHVTLQQGSTADELPAALLQTVLRTSVHVVLDDAAGDSAFARDPYVSRRGTRSVLCMPLARQSRLTGLLYLENDLIRGAFTRERTEVLEVLASQAAISLENARLYADLLEQTQQRERAVDALRDAQNELMRVSRLTTMGELVASIVHEVSQPLTAVGTSAGAALRWLERDEPDVAEAREMLESIVDDTLRAREVVRGLRALVKKAPPAFARFDLNAAIREVLALTRGERREHGIDVDEHAVAGECFVHGDRVQLQQVVLNLVLNALEAMAEVRDRPHLLTLASHRREDGAVRVVIEDSGAGLDTALAARLFEPFVTTKDGGLGMGLSICRAIVAAHDGELVAAQRTDARGAVFSFTLPAPRDVPAEP